MGTAYSLVALAQWYSEGVRQYGKTGFTRAAASFNPSDLQVDMTGKTVVVTGANKGLGRETADAIAKLGASVHILCRDAERGERARKEIADAANNPKVYLHVVDVSSQRQIREFAKKFAASTPAVDVLINNAGVMPAEKTLSEDGHEVSTATMLGGTFLLTGLLLPQLVRAAPSRVINISSAGMYNVKARPDDLDSKKFPYDGTLVYALNKRAQVILTEMWAEKLKDTGVTVNSMHPGWSDTEGLQTQMTDFYEKQRTTLRSAADGADTIVWLAVADKVKEQTGKFWFDRKAVRTVFPLSGTDSSPVERDALWRAAEAFCGLKWEDVMPKK